MKTIIMLSHLRGFYYLESLRQRKKSHDNQLQQRQLATESGRALVTNVDCKGHWGLLYNELLYNFCIWRMSTHEPLHCNLNM